MLNLTHLLLGLSKGVEVGQQGVSAVFVLLPEIDSGPSGEDALHAQSGRLPHLDTGEQSQHRTRLKKNDRSLSLHHSRVRQKGLTSEIKVPRTAVE